MQPIKGATLLTTHASNPHLDPSSHHYNPTARPRNSSARSLANMSTFKSSMLLAVGSLFLTQFINHSPYSIQTYPPVHDWADQPMKLVATPYYETKKVRLFDFTLISIFISNVFTGRYLDGGSYAHGVGAQCHD